MTLRTKDSYAWHLRDFLDEILVVCPKCEKKAIVKRGTDPSGRFDEWTTRVICTLCGYTKSLNEVASGARKRKKWIMVQLSGDPYFALPLWLSERVGEEELWAYNYRHLDFLKTHVEARHRERTLDTISNKSVGSRLPRWMTSKKNRESIRKSLDNLRNKV